MLLLSAPALAQGLFWKIEPPQGGAPSYLFGTIHTDDARVTAFSPAVEKAIQSVETFMLEALPPRDTQVLMMSQGSLQDWLTQEELAEVKRLAAVHGLQDSLAFGMKPWLLAVILAQPRSPSPFFQDMLLFSLAASRGKTIQALESGAEHFTALDELRMEEQLLLLRLSLAQTQEAKEQGFEQLLAAYLSRDAERILAVNEAVSSEGMDSTLWQKVRQALLERRNVLMAERVQAALKQGPVFVAVGAAHLAGKDGLLNRLRSAGYRLTALD